MQTSLAAILQLRGQAWPPRGLLHKLQALADTDDDKKRSKKATKTLVQILNVQILLSVFYVAYLRAAPWKSASPQK